MTRESIISESFPRNSEQSEESISNGLLSDKDSSVTSFPRNDGKKAAFTLAEVLITLGIIGVVAALTIPTLIGNYKKTQVVNQLKSNVSIISNAVKMAESKHGFVEDWELCDNTEDYACTKNIFDNYLAPELSIIKTCSPSTVACWASTKSLVGVTGYLIPKNKGISAVLSNGSSIYMWVGKALGEQHIQLWIDIDGPNKGKNTLGIDIFGVIVALQDTTDYKRGVNLVGALKNVDRNSIMNNSSYGCTKSATDIFAGRFCGALIQYDGWKISNDYPVKF